jgi:hypothetical protein
MLSAPASLASIMVIGTHHAAVTHVGDSSEVGQREHTVRQGFIHESVGLGFCVLVAIRTAVCVLSISAALSQ